MPTHAASEVTEVAITQSSFLVSQPYIEAEPEPALEADRKALISGSRITRYSHREDLVAGAKSLPAHDLKKHI